MTDQIAIRVEGLGKSYRVQASGSTYIAHANFRDMLAENIRQILHLGSHSATSDVYDFWALDDVSFEIEKGQVVAIIGSNGAGKSTLLKILSDVIRPTRGSAMIQGQLGSLLEVGIGFHPDLTGEENVYLNGVILGLKRAQVALLYDEIVQFAELEQFMHMPVKRYSSGMYVRLAFSVAIHTNPDILIVDEVLSVGDAAFQQKSLARITQLMHDGRTVLFVSHNIDTVLAIADKVIWLNKGRLMAFGEPNQVADMYYDHIHVPRAKAQTLVESFNSVVSGS